MHARDWQAAIDKLRERDRRARHVLGVSAEADLDTIRQAFRRASLASHPDVNGGDKEASRRFHLVCCAYKLLTEGKACAALDEMDDPPQEEDAPCRDNPWAYWCWWRERYFG